MHSAEITAGLARDRQAGMRADAEHRRLVRAARPARTTGVARRRFADVLIWLARRIDPPACPAPASVIGPVSA